MPLLDAFNSDAFSVQSLTAAFIKAPYQPRRLGSLGLFRESPISTTTVVVEEKDGQLELIQTSERGAPGGAIGSNKRTARSFVVPHLEKGSTIMADEVQNVRAFGEEDETETVQALVDDRLVTLRAFHETTLEHHRIGAVRGQILDADSSVIYDLFTEFGVTQQTHDIALGTATTDVRGAAVAIARLSEGALGADMVTGYRAFCGNEFFDELIAHAEVKESLKYQESELLRRDLRAGFEFGGITWENYRGTVNGVAFVPTAEAFVVPIGTDIFRTHFAPADFIETVNTMGLPLYAKIARDPEGLNRFVKIHSQSNPMCMCLKPRAIVKVTKS